MRTGDGLFFFGKVTHSNEASGLARNAHRGSFDLLPTDMALVCDLKFRPHVQAYAKDEALFFEDFAKAFAKLLELGVPRAALAAAASPREGAERVFLLAFWGG